MLSNERQNRLYLTTKPIFMEAEQEKAAEALFSKNIIFEQELIAVKAHRALNLFSVHNEVLMLLYVAILLFVGGLGILVYENIDTIGHSILIVLTFAAAVGCYYLSLKRAPRFSKQETFFANPVFDYVVLLGSMLSGVFFGYMQFQYSPLGSDFALASLLTSIVAFFAAYRFDNRSSLSIGITTLAATVGITMTPKAVMELDVFENMAMFVTGIALGIALIVWGEYSEKIDLKKHFSPFFYGFAQHLIGICAICAMFQDYWPIFLIVAALAMTYFYRKSKQTEAMSLFVFAIAYAFIAGNIGLIRLIIYTESETLVMFCAYMAPIFYLGSIFLFIQSVRKFNKDH